MPNHLAAIHVLKAKLQLQDADYRALLAQLTGKTSSKDLSDAQREAVRDHLQALAVRAGVSQPARGGAFASRKTFAQKKAQATPKERKVWALWNQLHREGKLREASPQALNAWVERTVGVSALVWCTDAQLVTLIEALKAWHDRPAP